jgi:transaldolase
MGASFRNTEEIEQLAGCDRLTISPELLEKLSLDEGELTRKLSEDIPAKPKSSPLSESEFRWQLNENPMATEKLAEGIRKFAEDQVVLENLISEALA